MYKNALQQDPTLWCAFERLCRLQIHTIDPSKVFNEIHPTVTRMNTLIKDYMQSVTGNNTPYQYQQQQQQSPQQNITVQVVNNGGPPQLFTKSPMTASNQANNVAQSTRSPVNQDMKENVSAALKKQQNLSLTNEDISINAGTSSIGGGGHMDEDSSF